MKNMARTVNKETLWREYAEAGNLCRGYEVLSRTSLAIFATFATAVVAYVLRESTQTIPNIILSLLGLIISVLTLTMMYRVREFYHVAQTRAVEIEKKLHMDLYQRLDVRFRDHYITPSNKIAPMWIAALFTISFAGLLGWELYLYFRSV
jgi:hypothetical protein